MDEYLGKICPYCKTVIKADENIIVCSDCSMPHHKECWVENRGCTTFGCLGTIMDAQQGTVQNSEEITMPEEQLSCFKCGFMNSFSNLFCRRCGAKLLKPLGTNGRPSGQSTVNTQALQPVPGSTQPSGTLTPINTEPQNFTAGQQIHGNPPYMGVSAPQNGASGDSQGFGQDYEPMNTGSIIREEEFIKDNTYYYRQKFMNMRMGNKKNTWNWSAFFFNVSWCFYRKMYKVGFIFLGVQILVSLFQIRYLNLLAMIPLGMFGNYFYMRHTENALRNAENVPDLQRYAYLRKKGGTSIVAVLLFYGGAFFVGILLGFLTEFLYYVG